jgi:hypothetical protein
MGAKTMEVITFNVGFEWVCLPSLENIEGIEMEIEHNGGAFALTPQPTYNSVPRLLDRKPLDIAET